MANTDAGQNLTLSGAAFDAFRDRGRSGVLVSATIGYLILAVVIVALFVWLNLRGIQDYGTWYVGLLEQMAAGKGAAPEGVMPPQSVMAIIPGYLLVMLCVYILLAAYEAACLRWLVRGEAGGMFLGLGLGADTWRVWFGYWLWLFIFLGCYLGVILVTAIVAAILGAARLDAGIVGGVTVLTAIAALCAFLWIGVRLAPASATSVAQNRFAFFDAWKVSRGRFWALFGSYLLLIVLYLVAVAIIVGVGFGLLMGGAFARIANLGHEPTPGEIFGMFASPTMIIGLVIMYALYLGAALTFFVALFGVNARAALVAKQEGRI